MSANKAALFVILFMFLNGFVLSSAGLAETLTDGTDSSAAVNPLFESQMGIFDTGNNSQSPPASIFISAPLPGLSNNETTTTSYEPSKLTIGKNTKLTKTDFSGPIIMRKVIPIVLENTIDSKLIKIGDPVIAKLKENLYYGNHLIATANSKLNGHVISCRNSRTLSTALMQTEDRLKSNAALEIQFDNLLTESNYTLPLSGRPVHQEAVRTGADGLLYGITVDRQGKIVQAGRTLSSNQKNTYNTLRVATMAPIPASLFINIAAAPIVMGTVGAVSPEIAFNRPLDSSMSHKRLKGMAYGFVTNLPGAFFVQAVVEKGSEIVLNNGDEMMIDITMNNSTSSPPVLMQALTNPEKLSVEGKLLYEKSAVVIHSGSLPLKPSIDIPAQPTPISQGDVLSEESFTSDSPSLASNDATEKEVE